MKQFKMYNNLTVGYNFAIILATIFGFTLSLGITHSAYAQSSGTAVALPGSSELEAAASPATSDATAAAGEASSATPTTGTNSAPIVLQTAPQETPEDRHRKACESNMKDLNDELAKMTNACSATKLGATCVENLFKCHAGSDSSDSCKKIREYEKADTRSEIDNKIEKLKKEREKLEKAKEKLEDQLSNAESDIDSLKGEQEDILSEKRLAEEALKEKLQENQSEAARHAEKLQAGIEGLQQKIRELHVATMEDSNALTNLIATSRIECLAKGRDKADQFVQKMRSCTQSGRNCGVTQATIYAVGKRSLEDLGNQMQNRFVRRCMSVNGNTEFGIKFMALDAQIKRKTEFLNAQRAELLTKQMQLQAQIQALPTQSTIKNTQSMLEKAQADQTLTQKEQQLMIKQLEAAAKVKAIKEKIEEQQQKIDKVEGEISEKEKIKASALNDDDLKRFKAALADINRLKDRAKDNASCGCTGAIQSINNYAGGICDGGSSSGNFTNDTTID